MKKISCLLLVSITFASCNKAENSEKVPRLTGWRAPNCSVTIGEGMYEAFNDSETKYLITQVFPEYVELLDTTVVSQIGLSGHTVTTATVNNSFFEFLAKKPVELHLSLLLNAQAQQISSSCLIVDTISVGKSSFNLFNALTYGGSGEQGCHRLYYVFSQKESATKSRIVNKGHFDIDVQ